MTPVPACTSDRIADVAVSVLERPRRLPWLLLGGAVLAVGALGLVNVRPRPAPPRAAEGARATPLDLSAFSADAPKESLRLLFIHHSCGGQLLAEVGPERERANCILDSHENGGGLKKLLRAQGYEVHEASYGSEVGEATDFFDWLPKFSHDMDKVLRVDENDVALPEGTLNRIVLFKSCYPNNRFEGEGTEPGDPRGPGLTVANAKATFRALLQVLERYPDVLFVYLTAPPLSGSPKALPLYRYLIDTVRGGKQGKLLAEQGRLARAFDTWVVSTDGWLANYPKKNVVVFDYYDVLTDHGASDLSRYSSGDGTDNHPSREGNGKAAAELVPFLNRAVRRAGLL